MHIGHRSSWLMAVLVLVTSVLRVDSVAHAGDGLLQVPVRWCAIKGSPAADNPGSLGEPDTDNVLWRRHERASDRIWIPGANITFRSAVTDEIVQSSSFPVIDDPNPPPGGPGVLGDILDPNLGDKSEWEKAKAACEKAWNDKFPGSPALRGPIVINVNKLVRSNGSENLQGYGEVSYRGTAPNLCASPLTGITSVQGGVAIADYFHVRGFDPDEAILAHEFGHALGLEHGNGVDDNSMNGFDGYNNPGFTGGCDPSENENATPHSLMTPGVNAKVITALQRTRARALALLYLGAATDPPAALIPGDAIGDERIDAILDVADRTIDISSVMATVHTPSETTTFSHRLVDVIPDGSFKQYLVFADLDNDPATGGAPADLNLGVDTDFQGAELVTRVVVSQCCGEISSQIYTPTVWKFQGGAFAMISDSSIVADKNTAVGGETPREQFDIISIHMSNAVRGAAGPAIRLQAFAQQMPASASALVDMLPDGPPDGALPFYLAPPEFPVCAVTPAQVRPGQVATVEAVGLFGEQMAKVILGDDMVGVGNTDAEGNVVLTFGIPADAALGPRLVTVGVAGTALTADCTLELVGPVCEGLESPVLSNVPAPIVVEQASLAGTAVSFTLPTATDDCGVVSVVAVPPSGSVFPLGATTVTVTATDAGGRQATATFTVTVEDTTAPAIASASASPNNLWPPNHKRIPVTVSVSSSDVCDATPACRIVSVSGNEPVNGPGDGNTDPDWKITGLLTAELRPERSGAGNGRVYTLTVRCTDDSGNSSTKDVAVTVPKSQK